MEGRGEKESPQGPGGTLFPGRTPIQREKPICGRGVRNTSEIVKRRLGGSSEVGKREIPTQHETRKIWGFGRKGKLSVEKRKRKPQKTGAVKKLSRGAGFGNQKKPPETL